MSNLRDLQLWQQTNTRCYYVDSDGDEVIVSDQEDFEVAIEYVKARGDKVKVVKAKRHQESSDEEDTKDEFELENRDSMPMIKKTVSVEGIEDGDSQESSDIDDIEPQSEDASTEQNEECRRNEEMVKDTVSIENSLYEYMNDQNNLQPSEESSKILESSLAISDAVSNQSSLKESINHNVGKSEIECSIYKEFTVIGASALIENPMQPIEEANEELKNSKIEPEHANEDTSNKLEAHSDEKLEPIGAASEESKHSHHEEELLARCSQEELELMKLNNPEDLLADPAVGQVVEPALDLNIEEAKEVEEEEKDQLIDEPKEFQPVQRDSVAVSCAKAYVVKEENSERAGVIAKALETIRFTFCDPELRKTIAQVDESEDEKKQEYVVSCKPGKIVKKRWRIVNNSKIRWPKRTVIEWLNEGAIVEIPEITTQLKPNDKLEISINIKIDENETENKVVVYVFRFKSPMYGEFGDPLLATVEIVPDLVQKPFEKILQEDKLKEFFEGEEINPIYYEMANDLSEDGMGTFEQWLEALLQWKSNYEEAKEILEMKNAPK